jgi:hypothetical protein
MMAHNAPTTCSGYFHRAARSLIPRFPANAMKIAKSLAACVAGALPLLTSSTAALADPRMDVIKGTVEGITLIGPKRGAPEAKNATAPAPAASAASAAARAASANTPTPVAPMAVGASAPVERAGGPSQWGDAPAGKPPGAGQVAPVQRATAVAPAEVPPTPAPLTPKSATNPKMSVIKGTAEGIVLIGPKPGTAAAAAAKNADPAASSASLAQRLSDAIKLEPPTGKTISDVKRQVGTDAVGIPLPTGTKPNGK